MRWIAHRGNCNGPNPDKENSLDYLRAALDAGYDVEVDVRLGKGGNLWSGHDFAQYMIDWEFLRDERVWTHCKTPETLLVLSGYPDINCFYLDKGLATLTSRGYVWCHEKCKTHSQRSVAMCLERANLAQYGTDGDLPYAVCSDWIPNVAAQMSRKRRPFDLLVVDIDGVMAAGKIYGTDGKASGKQFCDVDFTAIKRFQAAGVEVVFLSGDKNVNEAMAATRRIPFIFSVPGLDKRITLGRYLAERRIPWPRIAYVGDDYYDISVMANVGHSFCPKNSPACVRKAATHVMDCAAGMGVLAQVFDCMESGFVKAFPRDSADVNP